MRPRYSYASSNDTSPDFSNEISLTKQSLAPETDIHNILNQYLKTGIAYGNDSSPQYLDTTELSDISSSLNTVNAITDYFNSLPINLRMQFDNVNSFVNFITDPLNAQQCIQMGILTQTDTKASIDAPNPLQESVNQKDAS